MHRLTLRGPLPVLLAATALVAAGLLVALPALPARGATHEVQIANYAFAPEELTITVGDTVTWTNEDAVMHTATALDGAFDSGMLDTGESFSWTFSQPGTYDYLCTPHPMMTGRIIVLAPPATPTAAPTATTGAQTSNAPAATPAPTSSAGTLPNAAAVPPASPLVPVGFLLLALGALLTGRALMTARSRRRIRPDG